MILVVAAASIMIGRWEITELRDSMSDSVEVHATLNGAGGKIVYMCGGGSPRSILSFEPSPPRPVDPGIHLIQFRINEDAPQGESGDYEASYIAVESEALISRLRVGQRLRVRAFAYDQSYIEGDFDLTGASAALGEADRRCGPHPPQ